MIVKFKIFEEYNTLKEGDFVIIDAENSGYAKEGILFLKTHIGIIEKMASSNKICSVRFDEPFIDETLMFFNTNKVLYHTKNKENAESYLASMKYNL